MAVSEAARMQAAIAARHAADSASPVPEYEEDDEGYEIELEPQPPRPHDDVVQRALQLEEQLQNQLLESRTPTAVILQDARKQQLDRYLREDAERNEIRANQRLAELRAFVVETVPQLDDAWKLLVRLAEANSEPCRLERDFCQEHGWSAPCLIADVRTFLLGRK